MPTIAFYPWLALQAPITVGDVRLIPYRRECQPSDGIAATKADLDGVLAAYAIRKERPVSHVGLMEVGEWRTGHDADDETREKLFRAREFLAFAGLASRELFRGLGYCSFDNFAFYVQQYIAGNTRHFSFTTRRRDGDASILWGAEEFSFLKPLHVDANARQRIDEALFLALQQADAAGQAPFSAIVEFNRANTDSQDVPIHTEVVMMKSAFEYFLEVNHDCDRMVDALLPLIPTRPENMTLRGPLYNRWPTVRRGTTMRPIEAWMREYCIRRNESAHGARRGANPNLVWSEHAHLAFGSILLPLLVKQQLAQRGFYQFQERDSIQLELVESYLMFDPFAAAANRLEEPEHAWSRILSDDVVGEMMRRGLQREMDSINWANIPSNRRL